MCAQSLLQKLRLHYQPKLPQNLESLSKAIVVSTYDEGIEKKTDPQIAALFPNTCSLPPLAIKQGAQFIERPPQSPLRIGVVLSGGQAPGGHNVIGGLFDALKMLNSKSSLFGFCDGPKGVIENRYFEITQDKLALYRNQGGFDLIGSGRTKIETPEQFQAVEANVKALALDGLVVIGGDDSNTNAALLAEYFSGRGNQTAVIGVPKTIDGDLKGFGIEISFGFDSACKTYIETIGNLMRDALSAKKYYYFIKLMGRSASHITLECALQTHPNLALISEEISDRKETLQVVVKNICDLICMRALKGKDYGVILIPEGVIEFLPDVKSLIEELNRLLSVDQQHHKALEELGTAEEKVAYANRLLSPEGLATFQIFPKEIQAQLLLGRDDHGNVQVSKIETERLFIEMVKKELKKRAKEKAYSGKFNSQPHFCGYEGRSGLPSNFDSQYCYALGSAAALLINARASGYLCCISNLAQPAEKWEAGGIPLTHLMTIEQRHGSDKPVIQKALVNLKGNPFKAFAAKREMWAVEDDYRYPGPIQFFGPPELSDSISLTLSLESMQSSG